MIAFLGARMLTEVQGRQEGFFSRGRKKKCRVAGYAEGLRQHGAVELTQNGGREEEGDGEVVVYTNISRWLAILFTLITNSPFILPLFLTRFNTPSTNSMRQTIPPPSSSTFSVPPPPHSLSLSLSLSLCISLSPSLPPSPPPLSQSLFLSLSLFLPSLPPHLSLSHSHSLSLPPPPSLFPFLSLPLPPSLSLPPSPSPSLYLPPPYLSLLETVPLYINSRPITSTT